MTTLEILYQTAARPIPPAISHWENQVRDWCDEYTTACPGPDLNEIHLDFAVYLFDLTHERVVLAYALFVEQLMQREGSRMRGFPNVNASVQIALGDKAFKADRGHFLGHASGGQTWQVSKTCQV